VLAATTNTGNFTVLYAIRQTVDLDAASGEIEFKAVGEANVHGKASGGDGTTWFQYVNWGGEASPSIARVQNTWEWYAWRGYAGPPDTLLVSRSSDDAEDTWTDWTPALSQNSFDIESIRFGDNNRGEPIGADFAAIRIWAGIRLSDAQLSAERNSITPVITSGLTLDKFGTGANLAAALAAGTGTLTAGGVVTLHA